MATSPDFAQATHVPECALQDRQPTAAQDASQGNFNFYTLISAPTTQSSQLTAGISICPARTGSLAPHRHAQAEIYHILEGRGTVTVEGIDYDVEKGSTLYIPGNAEHGTVNRHNEELKWFYVFAADSFSEIVYRFS